MHPSFGIGVVAGNVVGDGRGGGLGALLEGDCPRDFRVSSKDGDWGLKRVLAKKLSFDSCHTKLHPPDVTANMCKDPV